MATVQAEFDRAEAAAFAAKTFLEIGAVHFYEEKPFIFTSGWASPVYIDCRKPIAFLAERRRIITMATEMIERDMDAGAIDYVAGGETAGIPYAAWLSETLSRPMLYVRKKPKGFGRDAQIEGDISNGGHVLLVEDLATDGGSKINFIDALRRADMTVSDIFVVFFYGAFPGTEETMAKAEVNLHYLCDWRDVLAAAKAGGYFTPEDITGVEDFLADPVEWSAANGGK